MNRVSDRVCHGGLPSKGKEVFFFPVAWRWNEIKWWTLVFLIQVCLGQWLQHSLSCFYANTKTLSAASKTHSQLLLKTLSAAVSTLSSCPFYSSPFLNSFLPIVDATLSPFHPKQMGCTVRTYLFSRKPCYEEGGQADIKLFCFSSLWPSGLRWPGLTSLAWLGGFTSGRKLAARPTIIHRYTPLPLYPSHASLLPRQNHITFLGYVIVWLFLPLICGSAVCMDDMWTCQLSGGTWYILWSNQIAGSNIYKNG